MGANKAMLTYREAIFNPIWVFLAIPQGRLASRLRRF